MEQYAEYGCFSLGTIAAHGRLFSQHELHLFGIVKSIDELENLLHFTSALLCRLQDRSGSLAVQENGGLGEDSLSGELNCDKYVASLQHVLWSLQHSVVDAIIRHYLNLIEADVLHWNRYWQRSKRIGDDGWFAEWPNSHRPLSTTWPWNIKPSLLVLWGVCWMFYGPSGNNNKRRPTRNPRGAAHLSEDLRTGPLGSQSQPSQQPGISSRQQRYDLFNDKDWKDPSEVWAGPASDTYPNYSWLHPTQAGVSRRANNDRESYAQSWDLKIMTNLFHAEIVTIDTLPTTSVSSYPYISAPSSNLYPTSTVTWPYCQGINPASSPAYAPSYSPWQTQSPFNPTGGLTTTPQRTDRSNTVQPYAQRIQTANTGNPPVATGTPGGLGFGLGLHMTDMQDYPSPGSSTSGQTASSYIPVPLPSVLSPGLPLMPSPSVAESTVSRQSSRRSQEPPRNAAGLLYCNHAEHAQQQPPVFSRKCEWR